MTIADQVAALEAELSDARRKLDFEHRRNDMQAGALRESRDQNKALSIESQRKDALIHRYEEYFRTMHRGLTDLEAKRASAAEKLSVVTGSGSERHSSAEQGRTPGLRAGGAKLRASGMLPDNTGLPLTADKPSSLTERIAAAQARDEKANGATNGHAA